MKIRNKRKDEKVEQGKLEGRVFIIFEVQKC